MRIKSTGYYLLFSLIGEFSNPIFSAEELINHDFEDEPANSEWFLTRKDAEYRLMKWMQLLETI